MIAVLHAGNNKGVHMEIVDDCAVFLKEDFAPLCEALVLYQMDLINLLKTDKVAKDFEDMDPRKKDNIFKFCQEVLDVDRFLAQFEEYGWPKGSQCMPIFSGSMHTLIADMGPKELWYRLRYGDAKSLD